MAYGKTTAITGKALSAGNWAVFDGIDVLQQQAFGQFEAWTWKPAPEMRMMEAVNERLGRGLNPAFLNG
jgi:shikimate 5-dehydrogenase